MKRYNYSYLINPLIDDEGIGYEAIIPKFPKLHVFADTIKELDEMVMINIEEDLKDRKKKKMSIPEEDTKSNFNGRILIRVDSALHERLFLLAQASQKSLNKFINEGLKKLAY